VILVFRGPRGTYRALMALRRELERLAACRPLTDPQLLAVSLRLDRLALRLMAEERRRERLGLEGREVLRPLAGSQEVDG
jgi:glutamate/tyrosine decarboxylase-like PLP-dependent enzyme